MLWLKSRIVIKTIYTTRLLSGFCHRHVFCSLYSKHANTLCFCNVFFLLPKFHLSIMWCEVCVKDLCLGWCDWEGGPSGVGCILLGRLCTLSFSLLLLFLTPLSFHPLSFILLSFPLSFLYPSPSSFPLQAGHFSSAMMFYLIRHTANRPLFHRPKWLKPQAKIVLFFRQVIYLGRGFFFFLF